MAEVEVHLQLQTEVIIGIGECYDGVATDLLSTLSFTTLRFDVSFSVLT